MSLIGGGVGVEAAVGGVAVEGVAVEEEGEGTMAAGVGEAEEEGEEIKVEAVEGVEGAEVEEVEMMVGGAEEEGVAAEE